MLLVRRSPAFSPAALSYLTTSATRTTPTRSFICTECLHTARRRPHIYPSNRRALATASAVRPQHPEFDSPPRNTGVPDTSITNSQPAASIPDAHEISLREGAAQQPRPVSPTQTTSTIATPAPPSKEPAAPRKSKLRPRKAAMTLTPTAVSALRELLDQPDPKMIRVGVKNRGCSGLAYHLEYVEKAGAFDEAVEQDGVKVLIDSKALFSIIGSQMDYVQDKLSQRFVFNNPNITEQCGCGESFSVG